MLVVITHSLFPVSVLARFRHGYRIVRFLSVSQKACCLPVLWQSISKEKVVKRPCRLAECHGDHHVA